MDRRIELVKNRLRNLIVWSERVVNLTAEEGKGREFAHARKMEAQWLLLLHDQAKELARIAPIEVLEKPKAVKTSEVLAEDESDDSDSSSSDDKDNESSSSEEDDESKTKDKEDNMSESSSMTK